MLGIVAFRKQNRAQKLSESREKKKCPNCRQSNRQFFPTRSINCQQFSGRGGHEKSVLNLTRYIFFVHRPMHIETKKVLSVTGRIMTDSREGILR
jgi:hypothetical protein